MPHIYIINHYATTPDSPSGSRHFDLAKALVEKDCGVTIFAAGYNHFTKQTHAGLIDPDGPLSLTEWHQGVRYVWVRTSPYEGNGFARILNMLEFSHHLLPAVTTNVLEHRPTLIIGSSVHPFAVYAAKQLADRLGIPWAFEIRDLWPQSMIDLGIAGPWHPFVLILKMLEKHLLSTTHHVLPVWPGMVSYLRDNGVPEKKITVLKHAVNFEQYPPTYVPRPAQSPLTLCYFGSHRANNALKPVIQAIANAQRERPHLLKAVFIGEGDQKEALQAFAREQKASIEFRPGVPKRDLGHALREMDGFVISVHDSPLYRKYGLSFNKLYDAAAIGRPILLTTDATTNLVDQAKAGWVTPPNNVDALTHAILEWLDASPETREACGINAWRHVRQHHDVKQLADTVLGLHRSLYT